MYNWMISSDGPLRERVYWIWEFLWRWDRSHDMIIKLSIYIWRFDLRWNIVLMTHLCRWDLIKNLMLNWVVNALDLLDGRDVYMMSISSPLKYQKGSCQVLQKKVQFVFYVTPSCGPLNEDFWWNKMWNLMKKVFGGRGENSPAEKRTKLDVRLGP